MEFVPLSGFILRQLALEDKQLRRVFAGVYPADKLPTPSLVSTGWCYGLKDRNVKCLTAMVCL